MCTADNLPSSLEAFLARHLMPLDKNPGLRPIGVHEVLQRIAGKVIVTNTIDDILTSVGSLQVFGGHEPGFDSLMHAMHTAYEEQSAEAVLLVDASNAFSSVDRNAFLHSFEIICSSVTRYVKNNFSLSNQLFIIDGGEIQSTEGTT